MPIGVVHVATGNVGRIALRHPVTDPRFELVEFVANPEKVGKDAGELLDAFEHGREPLAATDTHRLKAVPDVASHHLPAQSR